jgi:hypothetical protein
MSEAPDFEKDPELRAMLDVFEALKSLDSEAQVRVLDYVDGRLGLRQGHRRQSAPTGGGTPSDMQASEEAETRVNPTRPVNGEEDDDGDSGALEGISPVARKWMRRNDLAESQLSLLYSLGVDEIDLVARKVPGSSARERLRNVMLLQGVASYLSSGAPRVDNEKLREAAKHYDSDVGGNFNTYLKSWASEISGSRSEGNLTLTTRGLNASKDLIKEMTVQRSA